MRTYHLSQLAWLCLIPLGGCTAGGTDAPAPSQPAKLVLAVEPGQSATNGTSVSPQPVLQVVDLGGAPFPARGILVSATIASGANGLTGTTEVRTGVDGRATFTDLIIQGPVGPRTLRFSAPGLSAVISPTIQVDPGAAAQALILAGNNQTAAAGTAVPIAPQIRVVDISDNPVTGARVRFEIIQGAGSLSEVEVVTGNDGVATLGKWTLGNAVGPNLLRASVDGLSSTITFSATAIVGAAAVLTPVEGDSQVVAYGAGVPIAPAVRVTDVGGNPIVGVAITFAVSSGGGSLTGASALSNAAGVARVGSWRLGLTQSAQSITATRQGTNKVTFTATAVGFTASRLAVGGGHSCAFTTAGLQCWGDNAFAQFGNGTDIGDSLPVPAGGSLAFVSLAAGAAHTCGLTQEGTAYCWGSNNAGQLGDSSVTPRLTPTPVAGGLRFRSITAGTNHTCAVELSGAAFCWGLAANGRLGNGITVNRAVTLPTQVVGDSTWASVHAGGAHTCGRHEDGTLQCWGSNANGRLGDATANERSTPVTVTGGGTWLHVAVGGSHTCALRPTGEAYCWGLGTSGQLGTGGTPSQVAVPVAVAGGVTFTSISVGLTSTCALTQEGVAWCWGNNGNGRLGDGTTVNRLVPTLVAGDARFASLALGNEHGCGRLLSEVVVCWGRNAEGQVGDASTTVRLSPVGVRRP